MWLYLYIYLNFSSIPLFINLNNFISCWNSINIKYLLLGVTHLKVELIFINVIKMRKQNLADEADYDQLTLTILKLE